MAEKTYYVIGSSKVKQVLIQSGFKEINNPFPGHDILKEKRCYVKDLTYFYINSREMLVLRDMRYFSFKGKVVEKTFFMNILNSLPTKHWGALR